MSDTKSEPQQQHSSSSTESSSQTPQALVAAATTAVVESPPAAVSSPTSADSPAIIETTSTTLTLGDHGKPPLATEEDSSSTNSNIPAVTVTVIESSIPTANSSSSTTASSIQIESTFTATVHQPSIIVEQQTSVSSTEGSMSNSNNANTGGSGFRSSFNGRVPFARILSTGSAGDRRAVGNDAARVSGNLSNNLLNDIFAFVQQARNPNSLFSSERRSLFLQSGRSASHMPGSSTPPIGHATTGNPSDVVIDLDNATGPSLRSSNNEIYPISTSSSIASGIRPNSWMPANTTDEEAIASRASIMPNFNYHHHHHHFHNHQPLSTIHHHQHLAHPQPALLQQAQTAQQSQPASLGATGNGGSANEPPQRPSSPTNPNPNNGTRSNSVSSNQPNDEATVHEALNQIPEARAMMDTFARYIPLLFILVTKLCYDHLDGIIHFLALLMTFSHANWVVRQEISKQAQKRIMVLLREMIFIGIALAVVGFVLERKNIFLSILFMPDLSEPQTLKTLLFSVCMSDLVLKLLTIIVKIVITLMPPSVIEYKSRGKIYLMTESLSQLYRAAAPIQPWLIFLFESYSGSEKIVGVILSAVYMVAKSSDLLDRIKFCKRSVIKLLQKT
ncbi:AAEL011668-PA, partial [Aedes aegypti]